MMNTFDSNNLDRICGNLELSAYQHNVPFLGDWFLRHYSNHYSVGDGFVSIRHSYGVGNVTRWTIVRHYRIDTYWTVEVYDSVDYNGVFYRNTIYNGVFQNAGDAIHAANIHKGDR